MFVAHITHWVFVALALVGFLLEVWALVDALRRPATGFVTAEKRTKAFWMAILAVGALFGYLSIPRFVAFGSVIGGGLPLLFMLVSVLPAAIYLADVKPEVIRYGRGSGRSGW